MLQLILTHLGTSVLGGLLILFFWPREIVEIKIPATEASIDSLAAERVEVIMDGTHKSFTSEGYFAFIDSLAKTSIKTRWLPGKVVTEFVEVESIWGTFNEPECVPVSLGTEFRSHFAYEFTYPEGETSQVKVSLDYSQFHWALHPTTGSFKNFNISIPEISKSAKILKPPPSFLHVWGMRLIWIGGGIAIGGSL